MTDTYQTSTFPGATIPRDRLFRPGDHAPDPYPYLDPQENPTMPTDTPTLTDAGRDALDAMRALDAIAGVLSIPSWSPDTLEAVAAIVRRTGRSTDPTSQIDTDDLELYEDTGLPEHDRRAHDVAYRAPDHPTASSYLEAHCPRCRYDHAAEIDYSDPAS